MTALGALPRAMHFTPPPYRQPRVHISLSPSCAQHSTAQPSRHFIHQFSIQSYHDLRHVLHCFLHVFLLPINYPAISTRPSSWFCDLLFSCVISCYLPPIAHATNNVTHELDRFPLTPVHVYYSHGWMFFPTWMYITPSRATS
jgi:hypothetical protein